MPADLGKLGDAEVLDDAAAAAVLRHALGPLDRAAVSGGRRRAHDARLLGYCRADGDGKGKEGDTGRTRVHDAHRDTTMTTTSPIVGESGNSGAN
jgi:hypothetical protein